MDSKTDKIKVLVAEDRDVVREGIAAVLNAQPDMVIAGAARNNREAIQQFRRLQPDVTIVDWELPFGGGEEVIATLIAELPQARFVVIAAASGDQCALRAMSVGARSYLCKDMLRRELVPAIRAVHGGRQYVPDKLAKRLKMDP